VIYLSQKILAPLLTKALFELLPPRQRSNKFKATKAQFKNWTTAKGIDI